MEWPRWREAATAAARWVGMWHRQLNRPTPCPRRLAYDGRGNAVVKSEADIAEAVASLGGYEKGLYAEK